MKEDHIILNFIILFRTTIYRALSNQGIIYRGRSPRDISSRGVIFHWIPRAKNRPQKNRTTVHEVYTMQENRQSLSNISSFDIPDCVRNRKMHVFRAFRACLPSNIRALWSSILNFKHENFPPFPHLVACERFARGYTNSNTTLERGIIVEYNAGSWNNSRIQRWSVVCCIPGCIRLLHCQGLTYHAV